VPDLQSLASRVQNLSSKVDWWNTAIIVALVFTAFAAVAVVVTTNVAFRRAKQLAAAQSSLSSVKEAASSETISGLQKDATDAKATQQRVEIELSKQQERAAIAERALLELQERNKPRRLTNQQQQHIADRLRTFSGQKVNLFAYSGEFEVATLTTDLAGALDGPTGANWIVSVALGTESSRAVSGIIVEVMPNSDSQSQSAAGALVSVLKEQSLAVFGPIPAPGSSARMFTGKFDRTASISVTIGKKP
jgi:hypothetical protein